MDLSFVITMAWALNYMICVIALMTWTTSLQIPEGRSVGECMTRGHTILFYYLMGSTLLPIAAIVLLLFIGSLLIAFGWN